MAGEELSRAGAGQPPLDRPGQGLGLPGGPGGMERRVDQDPLVPPPTFAMQQGTAPQPAHERRAVRGLEHRLQGVASLSRPDSQAARHQVQVVVPEHHAEARPQARPLLARPPQHVERPRTAVHEVAGQPEPVAGGIEGEPAQQPAQRAVAALDVPDRVAGHVWAS